jgi:hypothetical protein
MLFFISRGMILFSRMKREEIPSNTSGTVGKSSGPMYVTFSFLMDLKLLDILSYQDIIITQTALAGKVTAFKV